jgi:hypothetical protein
VKAGGLENGHDAEITQRAKTSGQTLSKLKQAVDSLDGAVGKSGFQEGDDTAPMFLNALGQVPKGFEPTELCPLAPPAQGLLIFLSGSGRGDDKIAQRFLKSVMEQVGALAGQEFDDEEDDTVPSISLPKAE